LSPSPSSTRWRPGANSIRVRGVCAWASRAHTATHGARGGFISRVRHLRACTGARSVAILLSSNACCSAIAGLRSSCRRAACSRAPGAGASRGSCSRYSATRASLKRCFRPGIFRSPGAAEAAMTPSASRRAGRMAMHPPFNSTTRRSSSGRGSRWCGSWRRVSGSSCWTPSTRQDGGRISSHRLEPGARACREGANVRRQPGLVEQEDALATHPIAAAAKPDDGTGFTHLPEASVSLAENTRFV